MEPLSGLDCIHTILQQGLRETRTSVQKESSDNIHVKPLKERFRMLVFGWFWREKVRNLSADAV